MFFRLGRTSGLLSTAEFLSLCGFSICPFHQRLGAPVLKHLLLFASGEGTTVQAVLDAVASGVLQQCHVDAVITNRDDAGVIPRASRAGVPVFVVPADQEDEFSVRLSDVLDRFEPDLILLAGFLRKIPVSIVERFHGRMINTHPSLLPKYGGRGWYGDRIHRMVLENGDTESGCTIHYVNEEYDSGDIIIQKKVPVHPEDTESSLAERVKQEEKRILIQTLQNLLLPETS